jgi:hypothetical protein
MKKNLSMLTRYFSLVVIIAMMVPAVSNAQGGKANFAGTWTLNAEKSTMPQGGGGMRMGGGNFVAVQEANLLTVERTFQNQNGESMKTTMKYTLDGKESINASQRGDSKSTAKWSADGKTLTIETSRTFDMNGETRTMKTTEAWTLTDASTLAITSTRLDRDGNEVKTTMVYNK